MPKRKKGDKVTVTRNTSIYGTEDPPNTPPTGSVKKGDLGTFVMGPHMGRSYVKFEDGQAGWINNGAIT